MNIRQKLIEDLSTRILSIEFTKKDGSIRIMKCTRDFTNIPVEHHPISNKAKPAIVNEEIVKVFDVEISEWRAIRVDSILTIY